MISGTKLRVRTRYSSVDEIPDFRGGAQKTDKRCVTRNDEGLTSTTKGNGRTKT